MDDRPGGNLRGNATLIAILALSLAGFSSLATGEEKGAPGKVFAGWVEQIIFPGQELTVKAKLDSGARTSSIFAQNVDLFDKGDETWVRFDLFLEDIRDEKHQITLERPRKRSVRIKNHDGNHDRRVVVDLNFCFSGHEYTAEFTLADRNEFIYDVLLGREFLAGVAVIDPGATYLTQAACPSLAESDQESS